jgi:hypothetical protein
VRRLRRQSIYLLLRLLGVLDVFPFLIVIIALA